MLRTPKNDRPVWYIDTETAPFRPGRMAPPIACLTWAHNGKRGIIGRADVYGFIAPLLEDASRGKIVIAGHHISYDMVCLMEHDPRLVHLIFLAYAADAIVCTELRERLIDIANDQLKGTFDDEGEWVEFGYDLALMAQRICGVELDKDPTIRQGYEPLLNVPIRDWPKRFREYALDDASVGLRIYEDQEARNRSIDLLVMQYLEARADLGMQLIHVWGLRTDEKRVDLLWRYTQKRIKELQSTLIEWELYRPKCAPSTVRKIGLGAALEKYGAQQNMKLLRTIIEREWQYEWGNLPRSEKTRAVQTGKEVLENFIDIDIFDDLSEHNRLRKSGQTYVRRLKDGTVMPIHSSFWTLGARSARGSSSGPNLQNLPRLPGVRECIVPRSSFVIVSCDYKTQEMRTLAQACLDFGIKSVLAERFQTDPDFDAHLELAADEILEIPIPLKRAQRLYHAGDEAVTEARQVAKPVNFGLPGGMGENGLRRYAKNSYGVKLSSERAQRLISGYMRKWPEMPQFFGMIRQIVGRANYGTVIMPYGFRRGGCGYTDACNTQFQTRAAHATKKALFEAVRRMYTVITSALYDSRPINVIHDDITFEAPEGMAHEAAVEMEQLMADEMRTFTPDIPTAAEAVVMRHWSKKAKRTFDGDKLIPWDAPFPITEEMAA